MPGVLSRRSARLVALGTALSSPFAFGQQEELHGRKYQAPVETGHITVTVEKAANGKPLANAAVIFHATKNFKDNGNLELKTDPDGSAVMDLIEVGSHLSVQVIATGYATAARDLEVTSAPQTIDVKMLRPRAQISAYTDNDGKAATVQPGVQEATHQQDAQTKTPVATMATVSGTLKSEGGSRISGAVILLHSTGGAHDVRIATDIDGNFRTTAAAGPYELSFSADGYRTRTYKDVVLGGGDNRVFKESLKRAEPAAGNPQ